MWKHMRLRKAKVGLATKIASLWRGYCVRVNMQVLRTSADKIRKWWHNKKAYESTLGIVLEIALAKKHIRTQYQEQHAILIQRNMRRWLRWRRGMYLVKKMVVALQSRYRTWAPKQDVEMLRLILGPHVKRLPSQLVALAVDKQGKFTRYRAFRPKERVCPHVARIVRLKALPPDLREDLAHVVGKIQAFLKHRCYIRRVKDCQRFARGWRARRMLRGRLDAAKVIQRAVRRKPQDDVKHVTLVQAYIRGYVQRVRIRPKLEALKHKRRMAFLYKESEATEEEAEDVAEPAAVANPTL